jgi:hypothetical protein
MARCADVKKCVPEGIRNILGWRPMKKEKGTPRIWLKLPVAATPEVVEHAARMFKEAVRAATHDGSENGVTMTVENRDAMVSLNTWNARSYRAACHIAGVISSPIKEINKYPASQKIAAALAKHGESLRKLGGSLTIPGEDRPILLDQTFVATLEGAARKEIADSDCLYGHSEVYSTALRVGRMSESQPIKARISIDGSPRDVCVGDMAEEQTKILFDAVRTQAILRFRIDSRWLRGDGEGWLLDIDSMRIVSVTLIEPVTGAEFVRDLSEAIKPATEDEFAKTLEDLSE